jgi:hypothetical protein
MLHIETFLFMLHIEPRLTVTGTDILLNLSGTAGMELDAGISEQRGR